MGTAMRAIVSNFDKRLSKAFEACIFSIILFLSKAERLIILSIVVVKSITLAEFSTLEYLHISKISYSALKYYQIAESTFFAIICRIKDRTITKTPPPVAAAAADFNIASTLVDGYCLGIG